MTIDEAEKIKTVVENKDYIVQLVNIVAKTMIEAFENLKIEDVNMFQLGYNKALDDFVKFASDMPTVEEEDGEIRPMRLKEMAEQLKAGGENDIIHKPFYTDYDVYANSEAYNGRIQYEDGGWSVEITKSDGSVYVSPIIEMIAYSKDIENFEVIGNIFDNPELLESEE